MTMYMLIIRMYIFWSTQRGLGKDCRKMIITYKRHTCTKHRMLFLVSEYHIDLLVVVSARASYRCIKSNEDDSSRRHRER